jgi:hypothetical protein
MNAPAPAAPKDGLSTLLLLGGLGLAAIAVVKLDGLLQDLESRVWKLEAGPVGAKTWPEPEPEDAKPAGAEYAEELVNGNPVTTIRPKASRPRTVRAAKPAEEA